jgi:aryl-alcohol dehydrogenase-like predicted oxidoreductase
VIDVLRPGDRHGALPLRHHERERELRGRTAALLREFGELLEHRAVLLERLETRVAAPIPGTKHVNHLVDNLAAVDIVLTPDELAEIERITASVPVTGERYADTTLLLA